jgi:hypothetical protein
MERFLSCASDNYREVRVSVRDLPRRLHGMSTSTTSTPTPHSFSFGERVRERTGMTLHEIPASTDPERDVLCGHIVAHDPDTNTFVVFVGHPHERDEATGQEWWEPREAARVAVLP